jgi:hypothetical protein
VTIRAHQARRHSTLAFGILTKDGWKRKGFLPSKWDSLPFFELWYYLRAGFEPVKIIRPGLHHLAPLRQVLGKVVAGALSLDDSTPAASLPRFRNSGNEELSTESRWNRLSAHSLFFGNKVEPKILGSDFYAPTFFQELVSENFFESYSNPRLLLASFSSSRAGHGGFDCTPHRRLEF